MRRYETFVIFDPDLSEEERAPVIDRIKETIDKQDGFLVEVDDWGARKLAYEIKNKFRGYYSRLDYCGGGSLVNELERFFRIDDRVLKYMTVLLEKEADLEKIKEEIARAAAEKAQPQPEKTAEDDEAAAPSDKKQASETPAPATPASETPAPAAPASETPTESEPETAESGTETAESDTESAEATKEG